MLTLNDLRQAVNAYGSGSVSLDEFVDWYRAASRGKFGLSNPVREACFAIDAALSELYYGGVEEGWVLRELEDAVYPFASPRSVVEISYGVSHEEAPVRTMAAARANWADPVRIVA